ALHLAARENRVQPSDLDPFRFVVTTFLQQKYGVGQVKLDFLDYARAPGDQLQIINALAKHVSSGDSVTLDISHGSQYLPLLGALASLVMRQARKVTIERIYYGAFEFPKPSGAPTPVLVLDGLLEIADWLQAMQAYDSTGDYSEFAELLRRSG